ncbi:Histidine-specific methyltransferase EgtD [Posidoniimonas polymericola]|uniref:Histidine-specific methyltransferase EgtD n=1 Tax=Posidoniimonas polymericola TaxID=2528002 RepID=A0A5C5YKP7_9BACT|nr:L-histidine N(alpha)-methyltransferase [Posidoniimonas polymericola]TWT75495.1 Histidine-specific methyltransferase EgtD [Posidoniimonas polymericola]
MTAFDTATSHQIVDSGFAADVLAGLSDNPKWISSKHLYDKRGSELFDKICGLDEYYVTRAEAEIMRASSAEIVEQLGGPVNLIEFGSGSSMKTRLLLDHLDPASVYLPVDVSREHLEESCEALAADFPELAIEPLPGDFTQPIELPEWADNGLANVTYFPGSTLGNFEEADAIGLLKNMRSLCGDDGQALIGVDLQKDPQVIHAAYNDREGVTAEFTKNLLRRINRELGAEIPVDDFDYHAHYNTAKGRIEAALVSRCDQRHEVRGREISFGRGEPIRTEYSHKYTIPQFAAMADQAGFELRRQWNDRRRYFAVLLMSPTKTSI